MNFNKVRFLHAIPLAMLLSAFSVIGYRIEKYTELYKYHKDLITLFMNWFCIAVFFSIALYLCLGLLEFWSRLPKTNRFSFLKNFGLVFFLIFLSWLPYIVCNFPGVLYGDSYNMIYMASGVENLSTHHPIIYEFFLKVIFRFFHTKNQAVFACSTFGVVFNVCVLSLIVSTMRKNDFAPSSAFFALILFMFYPSFPMFSMIITTDMWFASCMGLFVVYLRLLFTNEKTSFFEKSVFVISVFGTALFRKVGGYLIGFTLVVFLIFTFSKFKLHNKKIIVLTCSIALFSNFLLENVIPSKYGITKGNVREVFSLPIQQMARILKYENVDENEYRNIMNYFFSDSNIAEAYYPWISDNCKFYFNEIYYKQNKLSFFKLAIKLLLKYPRQSLSAYFCNSLGYYYPIPISWFGAVNLERFPNYNLYLAKGDYPKTVRFIYLNNIKNIPFVKFFFSIATWFWFAFLFLLYSITQKQWSFIIVFTPVFILWLTCIASPVFNEQRYAMAIYIVLPVLIGIFAGAASNNDLTV